MAAPLPVTAGATGSALPPAEPAQDRALAALSKLSENQQEVIRLRIEHGLNYQQISEITDLSVSNVGYLLHVGLKSLRQSLS